jgi:hypothetical protein
MSLSLQELFQKKEELDEELKSCLVPGLLSDKMLAHPLLHEIFYDEAMNAIYNERLKAKKKAIREAKAEKDWSTVLWMYERPYRLDCFISIKEQLTPQDYWKFLAEIWIDSENIWQNKEKWKKLLSSDLPHKELFMSEEEQEKLSSMDKTITVYRGYLEGKNKNGFSYTLSKSKAEWFSRRFNKAMKRKSKVLTRRILKSKVFAYKSARGEEEIIILG